MLPNAVITEAAPQLQLSDERKQNVMWMLSLYGTAIGAGTLFLPIDAGLNGLVPLIVMAILAFPMTYYSHRALCRFVLSGSSAKNDITDVVDQHFGARAGRFITLLYFFSIYPILLMYSVAITNTTQSFIANQMHMNAPPRAMLAFILITSLMAIIRFGQQMIIKAMSVLVYPFISILLLLSMYLIPHWNDAILQYNNGFSTTGSHSLLRTLWLIIPVMVFSFNHSPIISSFAVNQKQRFGEQAEEKSRGILKYTHLIMISTVMFFVFSCVFSLSPQDLAQAKQQNISILSYLANHFQTPLIAYMAPFIAFIAIAKSFLGHYLGASEGLQGLLLKTINRHNNAITSKTLKYLIDLFIILSCWIIATINPNILTMIETLGGPIIAIILFLMPMYAIAKVPAMKKYRQPLSNGFVTLMGIIAISAILFGMWETMIGG
ncbi:serine/threonine transporter [Legionella nagasakiensis]|uniref:serine/threonine transporter n=1 Tax=Legionella nagasakiensis TaxID=535290 RepID=UPI0010555E94|nr:serine/threonine transporter [Legionella nagasakiensis]